MSVGRSGKDRWYHTGELLQWFTIRYIYFFLVNIIRNSEESEKPLNFLLVSKLCRAAAGTEQEILPFKTCMILQRRAHNTVR